MKCTKGRGDGGVLKLHWNEYDLLREGLHRFIASTSARARKADGISGVADSAGHHLGDQSSSARDADAEAASR